MMQFILVLVFRQLPELLHRNQLRRRPSSFRPAAIVPAAGPIMEHALDNQVVLITGAQGGLGTYVTEAFLASGAQVVGTGRQIRLSRVCGR